MFGHQLSLIVFRAPLYNGFTRYKRYQDTKDTNTVWPVLEFLFFLLLFLLRVPCNFLLVFATTAHFLHHFCNKSCTNSTYLPTNKPTYFLLLLLTSTHSCSRVLTLLPYWVLLCWMWMHLLMMILLVFTLASYSRTNKQGIVLCWWILWRVWSVTWRVWFYEEFDLGIHSQANGEWQN